MRSILNYTRFKSERNKGTMTVYIILIIILTFISYREAKGKLNIFEQKYIFVLLFLVLFLLSGLRKEVGTDFVSYQNYFNGIFTDAYDYMNIEIGYKAVNYLVATFCNFEQSIFLVTSFFIVLLFFINIRNYSDLPLYSIFCFVSLYFYFHSLNITRQYIAIAITFYSLKYLLNRNFIKYMLIILLASTFHRIAIVMIPFYFIADFKYNLKVYIIGVCLTLIAMISLPFIIRLVAIIIPKYGYYIDFNSSGSSAYFSLIISGVGFLSALFVREKFGLDDKIYIVLMNALYISVLFNILAFSNILMYRIGTFYMIYIILLIPRVIVILEKKWFHFTTIISSILVITALYQLVNNNSGVVPYNLNLSLVHALIL